MPRILLVDDHVDIRKMLRAGLESLGPQLEIIDVPSGEEAMLEAARGPIDLLITDIRLAGMNGLELLKKIRSRQSGIKAILLTGLTDQNIRREAAEARAEAFLLKPLAIAELLDAVYRCLGLKNSPVSSFVTDDKPQNQSRGLAERLIMLCQELGAVSVVLLDDIGRILIVGGDLPEGAIESSWLSNVMGLFNSSRKISIGLGMTSPEDLLCVAGVKYDLCMTHVGERYALLVINNKGPGSEYLGTSGFSIRLAAREVLAGLIRLGIPVQIDEENQPSQERVDEKRIAKPLGDRKTSSELNAVFKAKPKKMMNQAELDAFWGSLVEESSKNVAYNPDVLSFDQAKKLGLTPDGQ